MYHTHVYLYTHIHKQKHTETHVYTHTQIDRVRVKLINTQFLLERKIILLKLVVNYNFNLLQESMSFSLQTTIQALTVGRNILNYTSIQRNEENLEVMNSNVNINKYSLMMSLNVL